MHQQESCSIQACLSGLEANKTNDRGVLVIRTLTQVDAVKYILNTDD